MRLVISRACWYFSWCQNRFASFISIRCLRQVRFSELHQSIRYWHRRMLRSLVLLLFSFSSIRIFRILAAFAFGKSFRIDFIETTKSQIFWFSLFYWYILPKLIMQFSFIFKFSSVCSISFIFCFLPLVIMFFNPVSQLCE